MCGQPGFNYFRDSWLFRSRQILKFSSFVLDLGGIWVLARVNVSKGKNPGNVDQGVAEGRQQDEEGNRAFLSPETKEYFSIFHFLKA